MGSAPQAPAPVHQPRLMPAAPVLVDSSIWIDHINKGDAELIPLLRRRQVVMHPMVYGEIALGSLKNRKLLLEELRELPQIPALPHAEVHAMIEWLELYGKGVGFIDAHLLAATRLVKGALVFTRDKRFREAAERLAIAYEP
jgi:predicted nucleic acid-binding protein